MQKHYSLKKLVDQGNNFVIFEEFFDTPGNNIILIDIILLFIAINCIIPNE